MDIISVLSPLAQASHAACAQILLIAALAIATYVDVTCILRLKVYNRLPSERKFGLVLWPEARHHCAPARQPSRFLPKNKALFEDAIPLMVL